MSHPLSKGPLRSVPAPPVARMSLQTVREKIAAGAQFGREGTEDGCCLACQEPGTLDRGIGLCRPCWRQWRWSSVAEYQLK